MLKILSYNIRKGGTGREKHIASVIGQTGADIVVLQEATQPSVVERIAADCKMQHWGSKRGYSTAFISRVPVKDHQWHEPREMRRAFLQIDVEGVTIFGVHLSAVHSNVTELRRIRELNALLNGVKRVSDGFHLLAGDFNTLAPGEDLDLRRLPPRLRLVAWVTGGRVRYKTIQIMLDNGYVDGYRSLCYDKGFTFPTWDPHVRLDFFFLPENYAEKLKTADVIYDADGVKEASDHFPLLAECDLG